MNESTENHEVSSTGIGVNGPFPAELRRFNWGAFFLTWIWGIGNRSYLTFIALAISVVSLLSDLSAVKIILSFLSLGWVIYCGLKGNEWAWHNRKFTSIEDFKKIQKTWAIWGLVILILVSIGLFSFAFLLFSAIS